MLDWLRLARHQAVDSYLPDSETVRDSCLDDVAGCDLYVLIAGHRYGFQPAEDNPEGLSITQLEFRRAGECGIPRVALLRTSVPDVRLRICWIRPGRALVLGVPGGGGPPGACGGVQRPAGAGPGAERRDPGRAGQARKAGGAAGRPGGGGRGVAAGAAAGVPGRAGGAAGGPGCPAGAGEGRRAAGGGVVRAGRCGQDQRGGGVRAPASGRGGGVLAVRGRGPGGAGGGVRACWPPSWGRGRWRTRGIRWPRCTRCWPGQEAGWLVVFDNVPDRASVAGVRAAGRAGPGADHHAEPALAARPGAGRPGARPGGGGGFPGGPDR